MQPSLTETHAGWKSLLDLTAARMGASDFNPCKTACTVSPSSWTCLGRSRDGGPVTRRSVGRTRDGKCPWQSNGRVDRNDCGARPTNSARPGGIVGYVTPACDSVGPIHHGGREAPWCRRAGAGADGKDAERWRGPRLYQVQQAAVNVRGRGVVDTQDGGYRRLDGVGT